MYIIFKAFIFILTVAAPWWTDWLGRRFARKTYPAPQLLLVAAGLAWVLSGQLPNIHISNETNTFQEHFVGGGFYVALLFVYFKQRFRLRMNFLVSLLSLYALSSSLGVANELFEFVATKSGIIAINISDTSWDLVANTAGAIVGYLILLLVKIERIR